MTQKILTLPFRLGFGAARTAFDISAKTLEISTSLVETAIGIVRSSDEEDTGRREAEPGFTPAPPTPTATQTRSQTPTRPRTDPRVNGQSATATVAPAAPAPTAPTPTAPTPTAPVTPPQEQPDTPLIPEQDAIKTIEDQDEEELVAELAEPGAEDGAGAEVDVEEPWEGYAALNATAVIARIEQADVARLAVLELYEQTHKKRQTVLGAAAKRLRALSPPESE